MAASRLSLRLGSWRGLPAGAVPVIVFALLLGLLGVFGIQLSLRALEQKELNAAYARLSQDATRALVAVERDLQAYDSLLDLLADKAQLHLEGSEFEPVMDRRLVSLATTQRFGVHQITLVDTAGQTVWSSAAGAYVIDLTDREHIRAQMVPGAGLFFSAPLIGRVSNRWSVNISRRLLGSDGSFIGIGVLSVDPEHLAGRLRELAGDTDDNLALWRPDGRLMARTGPMNQSLQQGLVSRFYPGREGNHLQRFRRTIDGQERLALAQWVPNVPIYLTFSRATEPEMLAYRRVARLAPMLRLGVLLLASLGATLVILLLARRDRQEQWNAMLAQQAQSRAREAEKARLLDGMDGALFLCRLSPRQPPRLLFANEHVRELSGALVGPEDRFPLQSCLLPPLGATEAAALELDLRASGRAMIERQTMFGDKGKRWVRCTFNLLAEADGVAEVIGRIDDIETEKAATAAAMSTARLATLGEVATGLAHELNQPLAVISLLAENTAILLRSAGPGAAERATRRMQDIIAMTNRAKEITDHLRLFGRRQGERLEPVQLRQAVDGAVLLVRVALAEAGIALELSLPDDLPPVQGRQILLEQVLMNLLLNARDAMRPVPPQQRRIRIQAGAEDGRVWLRVEDSGPGIPPEILPRLFEPFFTTKGPGEGTGLGLAICHGIIRSFGGCIQVAAATASGSGACFTISLPVAVPTMLEPAEAGAQAGSAAAGTAGAATAAGSVTVKTAPSPAL